MSANRECKAVPGTAPVSRKELENLYARRSAIDSLIESLEAYARFGTVQPEKRESQTA